MAIVVNFLFLVCCTWMFIAVQGNVQIIQRQNPDNDGRRIGIGNPDARNISVRIQGPNAGAICIDCQDQIQLDSDSEEQPVYYVPRQNVNKQQFGRPAIGIDPRPLNDLLNNRKLELNRPNPNIRFDNNFPYNLNADDRNRAGSTGKPNNLDADDITPRADPPNKPAFQFRSDTGAQLDDEDDTATQAPPL